MTAKNKLILAPPYPVEAALKQLGANIRIARIRRQLTRQQIALKIGTGIRAVADAEKGKPSTGIVVYAALLWALRLFHEFETLADPTRDPVGQRLALSREKSRVRPKKGLDNDF